MFQRFTYHLTAISLALILILSPTAMVSAAPGYSGVIAYTTGDSIHLINPDGSNDHSIYTVPDKTTNHIQELAFSPDGSSLAFVSDQEAALSFLADDIYAVDSSGGTFRKITGAPSLTTYPNDPTGSVTVDVQVNNAITGPMIIFVEGADSPQTLIAGSAGTTHFVFDHVADLGSGVAQRVIAISGSGRWFTPGVAPDVIAGQSVDAGRLVIASSIDLAVKHISWSGDGSKLGFILGNCAQLMSISQTPPPANTGGPILVPNVTGFTCDVDYGPTAATANQVLYYEYWISGSNVYRATEGQSGNGDLVYTFPTDGTLLALHWLPDASGFIYSQQDELAESANLYLVKFGDTQPTPLTSYTSQFTGQFSYSPDGKALVYELGAAPDVTPSLWILDLGTGQSHKLVDQGSRPSWAIKSAPEVNFSNFTFLPAVVK